MSFTTAAAIYFVLWWVVLFTVLPFGVRNASEAGETVEPGNDPGAPTVPALGKKLIWTTIVTTVVFAVCWIVYVYRLVTLDDLATLWGLLAIAAASVGRAKGACLDVRGLHRCLRAVPAVRLMMDGGQRPLLRRVASHGCACRCPPYGDR